MFAWRHMAYAIARLRDACRARLSTGGTNIHVNPYGVDFQYEFEPVPQRFHVQWMELVPYFIDIHPVTQAQWETYLTSGAGSSRMPADTWHYLWDWDWSNAAAASSSSSSSSSAVPKPHAGNESKPVVYIGLDEARAYCSSLGKRLPREEEWQFAVSSTRDYLNASSLNPLMCLAP